MNKIATRIAFMLATVASVVLISCDETVTTHVVPVSGGGASGGNDNASDHGDTRSRAFKLSRCPARDYNWSIDAFLTSGDFDFFEVECERARGTLRAYTTGTTDTVGLLVPAYGDGSDNLAVPHENENNNWGGNFRNFLVSRDGAIGKYYIRVRGYLDTGPYVLKVEWRPYDAPDSWPRAENLSINLRNESPVSRPRYLDERDQDWFQFRISSESGCSEVEIKSRVVAQRLRGSLPGGIREIDPIMHLYSSSRTPTSSNHIAAHNNVSWDNWHFNKRVVLRNTAIYLIRVTSPNFLRGPGFTLPGPYTLDVIHKRASPCIGVLD